MQRWKAYIFIHAFVGAAAVSWTQASDQDLMAKYVSTQDNTFQDANALEKEGRYQEAIALYEQLLDTGAGRGTEWTAYLLFRLATAHYETGDMTTALETAQAAADMDSTEPLYQSLRDHLQAAHGGEHRTTVCQLRRDQGSAKRLTASNAVLHILVRGRGTEPWERSDREELERQVTEADRWLTTRAMEAKLAEPPTFRHRYIELSNEPFWRGIAPPNAQSSIDYRREWLKAVLIHLQATSYGALFDQVFEGALFANRAVIFHTLEQDPNYAAITPYKGAFTDLESAFAVSQERDGRAPYNVVIYTRELLHLYGADDLFNKVSDPDVPETEIMNLGAQDIEDCVICRLTQYAVGWTDVKPRLTRLHVQGAGTLQKRKGTST